MNRFSPGRDQDQRSVNDRLANALTTPPAHYPVASQETVHVAAGEVRRLAPPAAGMNVVIPKAQASNFTQTILLLVNTARGSLRIRPAAGTINGASDYQVPAGVQTTIYLTSDGDGGWLDPTFHLGNDIHVRSADLIQLTGRRVLIESTALDININSADDLRMSSVADIDFTAGAEGTLVAANSLTLTATGGIVDINAGDDVDIDATDDVTIDAGGDMVLTAGASLLANKLVVTTGALTSGSGATSGYLELREGSSAPSVTSARGYHWVRNDTPNTPMFTDDAGTSHMLLSLDSLKEDLATSNSYRGNLFILFRDVSAGGAAAGDQAFYNASNLSPFAFRVLLCGMQVTSAIAGSTCTFRDASGGGGNALTGALSTATANSIVMGSYNTPQAVGATSIASGGQFYCRFSDRRVTGVMWALCTRLS